MSLPEGIEYLWGLLVDNEIWRKWHRRTSFSFKDLGFPLTSLQIENELYFDEGDFKAIFKEKKKQHLVKFFSGEKIELPILSLPKANLVLDETIEVNDRKGYRTNRVKGSHYTAAILLTLYPKKHRDVIFKVLKSMAGYAPAEICEREYFERICEKYDPKEKAKQIKDWIAPRLEPYRCVDLEHVLSHVLSEKNPLFLKVISKMEQLCKTWSEESPVTNVALNPLLAIQDHVSLYQVSPDESYLQAVDFVLSTHLKWQKSEKDLDKKGRLSTIIKFLGDSFWAFVKVPLAFNKDISVTHSQKIKIRDIEIKHKGFSYMFALGDAQSLHIDFQLPSNVMNFAFDQPKMIEVKCLAPDEKWKWQPMKDPVKVFGRFHLSKKNGHFYTTKSKIRVKDSGGKDLGDARLVRINLRQELNTITRISLIIVLFSLTLLGLGTVWTGSEALFGSLALASTLLVTFASLPREDPVFSRKASRWLYAIGISIFFWVVVGLIAVIDNTLIPGLLKLVWKGIISLGSIVWQGVLSFLGVA